EVAQPNRLIRQHQIGLYLAESFKATSRLTLEAGVRWDYYGTPVYKDGKMANWDPATGNVIVAPGTYTLVSMYYPKNINVVVGDVVAKPKRDNLRPRAGFAFRLAQNTVLRGGYGEFTENPGYGENGRLPSTNPFWLKETYNNWIPTTLPALAFPRPFPTNPLLVPFPAQSVTAVPMKTEEGRIRQFNLTLERLLGPAALSVSYVGFRGVNMNYLLDVNKPPASTIPFRNDRKPYPQFGSAYRYRNDGRWRYDSLVARVRNHRGPVLLDSAFTWANNVANYLNTLDPYNVTNHWTRDGATRRLYLVTTASWSLPVGRGKRLLGKAGRWVNLGVGNWTLQAMASFATGQYYSPWFTGPDPANASPGYVTLLPDCVGNPNAGARNKNLWFNPAAFAIPPAGAGRYGNCGMNVLEGYPVHVAHASLAKQIPLSEKLRAIFTAQVSNVTNTPHFTFPESNLSEPNVGRFTASSRATDAIPIQQGPRQIMLKLRVEF
ncbi:MAG: TonB-dependent receptor domain-containing protein, partial [Bryobacteraceae bacterium]